MMQCSTATATARCSSNAPSAATFMENVWRYVIALPHLSLILSMRRLPGREKPSPRFIHVLSRGVGEPRHETPYSGADSLRS
jgi:hypothetical protein